MVIIKTNFKLGNTFIRSPFKVNFIRVSQTYSKVPPEDDILNKYLD